MHLPDQQRFQVCAIYTLGPILSIRCTRCYRWSAHIDDPLTLAELNRRAEEHAQGCR